MSRNRFLINILKKKGVKNLTLFFTVLIILFISTEIFLEFYFYGTGDSPFDYMVLSDNPILVFELKPDTVKTVNTLSLIQKDWKHTISINEDGYRGRKAELSPDKPLLLVLGDSFTFGVGVNDSEIFSEYLRVFLKDQMDVLNLAVPIYNTCQELELLKS